MKKLVFASILSLISFAGFSQMTFDGAKQFNVGVGLSSWGLPLYAGVDFGVHPDVTVGLEGSYRFGIDDYSVFGLGANANYHFNSLLTIPNPWDVYAGVSLGYSFVDYKGQAGIQGIKTSGVGLVAQIGARYFFTDKMGVNLELGGGNVASGGKLGLTFKL